MGIDVSIGQIGPLKRKKRVLCKKWDLSFPGSPRGKIDFEEGGKEEASYQLIQGGGRGPRPFLGWPLRKTSSERHILD